MSTAGTRGYTRCGAAAVLFGAATPLAARIALHAGAPALAGMLYVGAALGVAPFVRRPAPRSLRIAGRRVAASVVVGGFIAPLLLAAGLSRSDGATASLLLNLELVATVLLAGLFFREHIGQRVAAGSALVVGAGMALAWTTAPQLRVGALLVAAACVCWGVDNCVTANIAELQPEVITFAKGAIAGVANLAIAFGTGARFPSPAQVGGALVIGVFGYGLSITLWIRGARDIGAARGQLVFAAAPLVGVTIAWVALHEAVRGGQVVALLLAMVGVLTVLRSEHEHRHAHAAIAHEHEHSHDDGHHSHPHDDPPATHTHPHEHLQLTHAHPHLPDLHHRHDHR